MYFNEENDLAVAGRKMQEIASRISSDFGDDDDDDFIDDDDTDKDF